ncbi:hypothetical protein GBAR_LOCUS31254, partial [Geodia barretti]
PLISRKRCLYYLFQIVTFALVTEPLTHWDRLRFVVPPTFNFQTVASNSKPSHRNSERC